MYILYIYIYIYKRVEGSDIVLIIIKTSDGNPSSSALAFQERNFQKTKEEKNKKCAFLE
jgi:hypothetical protein